MRTLFNNYPEQRECCGTCKYNYREKHDTFSCANEESEYYASYTGYDDWCDCYDADLYNGAYKDGLYEAIDVIDKHISGKENE